MLANPPFGKKSSITVIGEDGRVSSDTETISRDDFWATTSNKQLNFLQHVLTILKPGGRAAIVVPDNVLFANQAGEVFQVLMEDCDVHTVLRCPRGTFSPYTEGTKTNVIFFTKGYATKRTWIYEARANVPKITKKSRPLTAAHFTAFEKCYGDDPNGRSNRTEADSPDGRWRSFTIEEVKERHFKLDAFKWLRDEELDDPGELPEPEELIIEAMEELQLALDNLVDIQRLLEGTGDMA